MLKHSGGHPRARDTPRAESKSERKAKSHKAIVILGEFWYVITLLSPCILPYARVSVYVRQCV